MYSILKCVINIIINDTRAHVRVCVNGKNNYQHITVSGSTHWELIDSPDGRGGPILRPRHGSGGSEKLNGLDIV